MFGLKRQTSGSVVCPSCGSLVGVRDERCYQCGRRNPGLWGFAHALRNLGSDLGFTTLILGGCSALYALSLLLSRGDLGGSGPLSFLSPRVDVLFLLGASGAVPVFNFGRWWTLITAGWLHASVLHILFNMLWVRQLGPAIANLYGPGRLVIIYTVAGMAGFALSSFAGEYFASLPIPLLRGARFTVGASAPIFGLFGALVCYGRRTGSKVVHSQGVSYALTLFLFGLIMPGVDNYAHAGGFIGGYATAHLLDPRRPERTDHVIGALVCFGATILGLILSIADGFRLLAR